MLTQKRRKAEMAERGNANGGVPAKLLAVVLRFTVKLVTPNSVLRAAVADRPVAARLIRPSLTATLPQATYLGYLLS